MFGESPSAPIGNLSVVEALGSGTWLARHPMHGRCVLSLESPEVIEAKRSTLARLSHPGLRKSFGVLSVRQGIAHVTTHLAGVPLSRSDRRRYRRCPREATALGVALLELLEHTHERGVVHGRLQARHVIVGESIGLVGFGQTPAGGCPQDDVEAVAGLLFELVTGEPWTTWSPPVSYFAPEIGAALDEWLEILVSPEPNPPIDRLRFMLRAVRATMPPAPAPASTRSTGRPLSCSG